MATTKWGIDPTHTEVQFKVKHLVIATVTGFFKKFSGSIESASDDFDGVTGFFKKFSGSIESASDDFDGATANFSLDVNSIDTNQADRDAHLKSPDFFAADQYPTIDFKGTVKKVSGSDYKLVGDLTMRGTTKAVELSAEFGGIMVDPWGNTKAGFEINGKVNRKDFGLNWSAVTEAGGVVVSDEVKLHLNVELAKG
ncbi:MAG: polyisoprenoid-binding protein [Cytophagia bacterium]|nr:polyisoprenoid-binding protein [Cytophagia bacterium]